MGVLRLEDERMLFGQRWRSRLNAQGRLYRTFSGGSLAYAGADTGPVLDIGRWGEARPLFGLEYARLGNGPSSHPPMAGWNWPCATWGRCAPSTRWCPMPISTTAIRAATALLRLRPQLAWNGLLATGDRLTVDPEIAYNAARGEGHRYRYWSAGAAGFYMAPLFGPVAGFQQIHAGPELTIEHRQYASATVAGDDDRRDWRLSPGLRLIGTGFLEQDLSVVLRYYIDNNRSNEADKEYTNHTVSLVVYRRF